MSFMASMFGTEKPVIGMLHLQPLPGDPLYYPGGSVSRVIDAAVGWRGRHSDHQ